MIRNSFRSAWSNRRGAVDHNKSSNANGNDLERHIISLLLYLDLNLCNNRSAAASFVWQLQLTQTEDDEVVLVSIVVRALHRDDVLWDFSAAAAAVTAARIGDGTEIYHLSIGRCGGILERRAQGLQSVLHCSNYQSIADCHSLREQWRSRSTQAINQHVSMMNGVRTMKKRISDGSLI